jgi:hypothetical protein
MKLRRQRPDAPQGAHADDATVASRTQWRATTAAVRDALVDDAVTAYVEWREESATVWACYGRWDRTSAHEATVAHAAYRAALDREEAAARTYSTRVELLAGFLRQ